MKDSLWVSGTCDRIILTLQKWIMIYHNGKVSATGRYLTSPGEQGPQPQEIERPTRYACKVAWTEQDLDYFIKILEAKIPDHPVTKDLRTNFPKWKNGKLIHGGARVVTMDIYFSNLVELYRLMEAVRDGKTKETVDLGSVDLSSFTGNQNPGSGS